jgi:hypothetical protein
MPVQDSSAVIKGFLIALLLLLLGVGVSIGLAYLIAGDRSGISGLTMLTMPYDVNLRPLPDPGDQDILPARVGPFIQSTQNSTLKATSLTGQAVATYVDGSATITARAAMDANGVQAQSDLSKLAASVHWPKAILQEVDNAGYFEATDPTKGTVRLIYVRHYWLFDLTASNQAALDTFVKAFAW